MTKSSGQWGAGHFRWTEKEGEGRESGGGEAEKSVGEAKRRELVGMSGDVLVTKETSREVLAIRGQCWAPRKF